MSKCKYLWEVLYFGDNCVPRQEYLGTESDIRSELSNKLEKIESIFGEEEVDMNQLSDL